MRNNHEKAEQERDATLDFLAFAESHHGDVPTHIVAGALIRASAMLAAEAYGDSAAPEKCRHALEVALNDHVNRSLQ